MLASNATRPGVRFENRDAKGPLSKARCYELRRAVTWGFFTHRPGFLAQIPNGVCGLETRGPDAQSFACGKVVLDIPLRADVPIRRLWHPGSRRKEDRLHKLNAADLV